MQKIKECIREVYRFTTLRVLFPFQYKRFSGKKIQKGKAVFIESQLPVLSDSMSVLYERLKEDGQWRLSIHCLRESFVSKRTFIKSALYCLEDIADAEFIFLCDASRLVSCIPKRQGTTVVQLWHGCGAFKKFGMSTADLHFGGTRQNYERYPYYGNLDYVMVSSPEVCWAYEEAMNLKDSKSKVIPLGISRTDVFFDQDYVTQTRSQVEEKYPFTKHKKIILYAPTFRGNVSEATAPDQLDIEAMCDSLSEEYILMIKHHPLAKKRPEIPEKAMKFAFDVTDTLSIEQVLCTSDICISDYSSLIFEYSLFEKPMIFFAYDLEDYHDWRGFYYNYDELTPGPVVRTTQQIIQYIENIDSEYRIETVKEFREKYMSSCDGHATDRLLELLKTRR